MSIIELNVSIQLQKIFHNVTNKCAVLSDLVMKGIWISISAVVCISPTHHIKFCFNDSSSPSRDQYCPGHWPPWRIRSGLDRAEAKADLIVRVCRPPSGGHAGDHVEGEQRTVCRVDDGQGPHCVLVEQVSQERVIAEETRHPGLAHTTLTDIQVAELLTPAGEIFREGDVSVRNFLFLRKIWALRLQFPPKPSTFDSLFENYFCIILLPWNVLLTPGQELESKIGDAATADI